MAPREKPKGLEKLTHKLFWPKDIKDDYNTLTRTKIPFSGQKAIKNLLLLNANHRKNRDFHKKELEKSKKKNDGFVTIYGDEIKDTETKMDAIKSLADRIRDHMGN